MVVVVVLVFLKVGIKQEIKVVVMTDGVQIDGGGNNSNGRMEGEEEREEEGGIMEEKKPRGRILLNHIHQLSRKVNESFYPSRPTNLLHGEDIIEFCFGCKNGMRARGRERGDRERKGGLRGK